MEEVENSNRPLNIYMNIVPRTHVFDINGKFAANISGEYSDEILDYIKHKRIEINSVITALHDNARFWEWIIEKLRKQFHNRDYNRSVTAPKYEYALMLPGIQ